MGDTENTKECLEKAGVCCLELTPLSARPLMSVTPHPPDGGDRQSVKYSGCPLYRSVPGLPSAPRFILTPALPFNLSRLVADMENKDSIFCPI